MAFVLNSPYTSQIKMNKNSSKIGILAKRGKSLIPEIIRNSKHTIHKKIPEKIADSVQILNLDSTIIRKL